MRLIRPRLELTQQPDSTWDLLRLFGTAPDTTAKETEAGVAPDVWIDHLALRDGAAALHFYTPRADSTWHLHRLDVQLDTLRLPPEGWPAFSVRTLEAV
ncbi:hypothetical protein, partial [Rhodothermus marinus]|uniref:hypothetical protein n=1 Tax=Rhodothermus marinus TaxID=29549 RepID=UPI001FB3BE16